MENLSKENFEEFNLTVDIFNAIENKTELNKVCKSFMWLIDNDFIDKPIYLHVLSQITFRRIYKLHVYGN